MSDFGSSIYAQLKYLLDVLRAAIPAEAVTDRTGRQIVIHLMLATALAGKNMIGCPLFSKKSTADVTPSRSFLSNESALGR